MDSAAPSVEDRFGTSPEPTIRSERSTFLTGSMSKSPREGTTGKCRYELASEHASGGARRRGRRAGVFDAGPDVWVQVSSPLGGSCQSDGHAFHLYPYMLLVFSEAAGRRDYHTSWVIGLGMSIGRDMQIQCRTHDIEKNRNDRQWTFVEESPKQSRVVSSQGAVSRI